MASLLEADFDSAVGAPEAEVVALGEGEGCAAFDSPICTDQVVELLDLVTDLSCDGKTAKWKCVASS